MCGVRQKKMKPGVQVPSINTVLCCSGAIMKIIFYITNTRSCSLHLVFCPFLWVLLHHVSYYGPSVSCARLHFLCATCCSHGWLVELYSLPICVKNKKRKISTNTYGGVARNRFVFVFFYFIFRPFFFYISGFPFLFFLVEVEE